MVDDPQLLANDGILELDGGGLPMRSVNGPISFSGVPAPEGAGVPALGEHTDQVLEALAGGGWPVRVRGER